MTSGMLFALAISALVVAVLVGAIGILQSLDLLGVRGMLEPLYAPFGYSDGVQSARAGSTVGLPAATADLMVLTKVDLLPYLDFDLDRCVAYARRVNPRIRVLQLSATKGAGLDDWLAWLEAGVAHAAKGEACPA